MEIKLRSFCAPEGLLVPEQDFVVFFAHLLYVGGFREVLRAHSAAAAHRSGLRVPAAGARGIHVSPCRSGLCDLLCEMASQPLLRQHQAK